MANQIYNTIFNFLKSIHFHHSESWVIDCVDYYKSSNPSISLEELKNEVKQQWLLSNLRETKVAALPPNLKTQMKAELNGKYVVQVETMLDSGQPRYAQYQKFKNKNSDNLKIGQKPKEDDLPDKRCLTLNITDGVQNLHALEYEFIPALKMNDPDMLPGFKMLITGPVTCRRGMFVLSPRHVTVLGGEVDVLVEKNSTEKLLMAALQIDGPSPTRDNSPLPQLPAVPSTVPPSVQAPTIRPPTPPCPVIPQPTDAFLDDADDFLFDIPMDIVPEQPPPDDDEAFMSIPDHPPDPTPALVSFSPPRQKPMDKATIFTRSSDVSTRIPQPRSFSPDMDYQPSRIPPESPVQRSSAIPAEILHPRSFIPDMDTYDGYHPSRIPPESPLPSSSSSLQSPRPPPKTPQSPKTIPSKPFVYLLQICQENPKDSPIYNVKAVILTLKTKIAVENDEFTLTAKICDGSLSLDVNFSTEVLEDLLGFSPCEMQEMIKVKKKNIAVGTKLKAAFINAQHKLINLNCIFKIQFCPNKTPLVLALEEITRLHLSQLQARQN